MDTPANTIHYFFAGYAVIFGSILIYIINLIGRWRKLKRDAAMLEELERTRQTS
ncbi:MAG TPA: hypothetical protein PLS77_01515 [Anaerolineaceae bacterium]|nr:hypothetical protein [Longilinea sp.]HNZ00016.1 hypothetical protein [Anaerolineaceae bacterium]HOH19234.1 hypothetical protein [Anaerolineaceae bacterium]HOU42989.1 hypothetical protein [Anaerolineaceae bacterium]HPA32001.1 hypothetical protein [Anaerolineaceae bacterium]